MWKKTLLALCVAINIIKFANANETAQSSVNIEQLKQQWLAEYKHSEKQLEKQRENFLQLESLLQLAEKQGKVTPVLLQIAEKLQDPNYPLYADSQWAILKAKLSTNEGKNPEILKKWIADFSAQFPQIAKRQQLEQRLFSAYFEQQQFEKLVEYAKSVTPQGIENQCRVFSANYQLLAEKFQPNPEAEQASNSPKNPQEFNALLQQFENFWLNTDQLSSECGGLEAYWRDLGLKTDEKIRMKAVRLFEKNAKKGLEILTLNASPELNQWLLQVLEQLKSPQHLQNFAENQPLDPHNKAILLKAFPNFIRTLPEQLKNPDYSRYQTWAERWGLSDSELRDWKIQFVNRLFDNNDPIFQLWRDEQIKQLKADNLTERRLRMAIWQQTHLAEWLALLSDESNAKTEWRYWLAKSDTTQQKKLFEQLSKERGFYPMLAANQLKKPYQLVVPEIKSLTESQKTQFNQPLKRISELRTLARFGSAKLAWLDLLQAVSFEEKIALADYAIKQNWYDLAVEATIQAKAWDYISLRLPNAYADWFELHLADKPIRQSFAMAIARQESAWNFQARSHANAIGLMQMLPTTALATAQASQLPYQSERDLTVPFSNIMLGTAHLAELNQKYPNNRILISAAYNAGASRVERWLARANGKLAMDEFIASIPFYETRGYVQNVLAYDFYYQHLYGKDPVMFYPEELRRY